MEPTKELLRAVAKDDAEKVKKMIARLKDEGKIQEVDDIIKEKDEVRLIHVAAMYDAVNVAEVLFTEEALLSPAVTAGAMPMHFAAASGAIGFMDWYAIHYDLSCDPKDLETGQTPLHVAALYNRTDSAAFLLGCGADLEARDFAERTPLHYACSKAENEDMQRFLVLKAKANLSAADNLGNKPAHYAAARNNEKLLFWLYAKYADMTSKNNDGVTPYDLASTAIKNSLGYLFK